MQLAQQRLEVLAVPQGVELYRLLQEVPILESASHRLPELPHRLVAAPTEALPSGALVALFSEAGGAGAAEQDLSLGDWQELPPTPEPPAVEAAQLPEDVAWLLLLPVLALGAHEPEARREGLE